MKLLHLADLHLGKHVNGFPMLEDQRHVLQQALDAVESERVDAVLLAGDIYDKSSPSAEAVALADWFFSEVSARGAALVAVAGNHDSAERIAYGGSIFARQQVFVSPVYQGSIQHVRLEDEAGPVDIWLVPFLRPASVRPFFPDEGIETYTDALRLALSTCKLDPDVRNVAVAHQFVTGSGGAAGILRSDSETVSVGGVDNVDAGVFAPFDYVALGHIHAPQQVGRQTCRYAGSPLKYSFSEKGAKTAVLVTLGDKRSGSADVRLGFIPLEPLHDMREIRGPLEALLQDDVASSAPADDYLHVTLTDENPPLDALARLRSVYPNVMALDYDNARTHALGTQGEVADVCEEMTPFEHFSRFYELQNGMPLTERQERIVRQELDRALGSDGERGNAAGTRPSA